ncbi:ribonuclease H-like domain-containing protein [Tanacetum coccineum]
MVGASPSGFAVVDSINNIDAALQARNKYGFYDGTCLKESYATSNVLSAQWDRCNAMVLTWIMNVVSQDVYMGLVYSENVVVVWKELNKTYDKVDGFIVGIPESTGGTESKQNGTSFVAKTFNNNKKQFNNNGNNIARGKQSFNANSDVKLSDKTSSISLSISFTYEQIQKILNLINDKPSGSIHANIAGRASFFNGNIIDSGANQHLTGSTFGMSNVVDISKLKITVGHPNGTLAVISHVGNLKLANNVILYVVLVIPGYCVSLLSVNKLIRDSKMFVGFDENKCYIQDLKRERVLGTSSESSGLCLFDVKKTNCIGQCTMVMTFHVCKVVWHNRLGHLADQVLYVVKKDLNIFDNTFVPMCKICQRAKQTREPFPLSGHKSKTLSKLVHLDLWGSYSVHSREGYRYFLTIVDDYTKEAVWVYLVKTKDEERISKKRTKNAKMTKPDTEW